MAGYKGSDNLQTSIANQEIIPNAPEGWTINYSFYKFQFLNDQNCHIIINGEDPIFIRANQGFAMNNIDKDSKITSFQVVENNITFNWFGHF